MGSDDAVAVKNKDKDKGFAWLDVPKWYVWEGGFLVLGRSEGVLPPHMFHAIQILNRLGHARVSRSVDMEHFWTFHAHEVRSIVRGGMRMGTTNWLNWLDTRMLQGSGDAQFM